MLNIAIDIMGGDNAPVEPIKAIKSYLKSNKDIYFYLIGDKNQIIPIMGSEVSPDLYTIVHTEEKINMNDKPSRVIKTKPNWWRINGLILVRVATQNCAARFQKWQREPPRSYVSIKIYNFS